MPITKKITTATTVTEEHYGNESGQATDLPLENDGTNVNPYTSRRNHKQIETGESFSTDLEEKNQPAETRSNGKTYPDLISEFLKNPNTEYVIILCYIIGFLIAPKNMSLKGIEYPLIIGTVLSAIWFFLRILKWLKYKFSKK